LNFCEEFNEYEYGSLRDFKPPTTTNRTEQSIAVDKSSAKPVSDGHRDSGVAENEQSIYEAADMLADLKSGRKEKRRDFKDVPEEELDEEEEQELEQSQKLESSTDFNPLAFKKNNKPGT